MAARSPTTSTPCTSTHLILSRRGVARDGLQHIASSAFLRGHACMSLQQWITRMLHPCPAVHTSHVRQYYSWLQDTMLMVCPMSRFAQPAELQPGICLIHLASFHCIS